MRKLNCILLAMLLVFSCGTAAFASETPSSQQIGVYAQTRQEVQGVYTAPVENGVASVTVGDVILSVTGCPEAAVTLLVIPMEGDALSWVRSCLKVNVLSAWDISFQNAQGERFNADGVAISVSTYEGRVTSVSSVTTSGTVRNLEVEIFVGKLKFQADGSHYYVLVETAEEEPHEHSFTTKASNVKAADASCTEAARYYVQCDECTDHTTEKTVSVGEPLGHNWDTGTVTTKPTCEKDGVRTFTCQRDSSHTYHKAEPATGHSFSKYHSNNDATCKKDGTETAKCDNGCGKTDTRTDKGSKLGHKYQDGKCIRCGLSWWNPETEDEILIAVAVLAVSGAALVMLLLWKKRK